MAFSFTAGGLVYAAAMGIVGVDEVEITCFFHRWRCHLHCSKEILDVNGGWVVDNGALK